MARHVDAVETRTFGTLLLDAFVYPFRGQGKWLLLVGAGFLLLVKMAGFVPLLGLIAIVVFGGYMWSFLFEVVGSSAAGQTELPNWPSFDDIWDDAVRPMLLFLAALVVSAVPAIAVGITGRFVDLPAWAPEAAWVVGLLYLPMAVLGVALNETFGMVSPVVVIPAILRVPVEYGAACLVLAIIVGIEAATDRFLVEQLPILGWLLGHWLSLYVIVAQMRVLGVLYYTQQEKIGWFRAHRG